MKRGWYSRLVFPRLVHWSMGQAGFIPLRQLLLSQASGVVLEIGFGTGANYKFYPSHIHSLTAIDPNPGMIHLARSSLAEGVVSVHLALASAEWLPFPSASFDTVISTMTLCSVPHVSKALQELLRALKPGGRLVVFGTWAKSGSFGSPVAGWSHASLEIPWRWLPFKPSDGSGDSGAWLDGHRTRYLLSFRRSQAFWIFLSGDGDEDLKVRLLLFHFHWFLYTLNLSMVMNGRSSVLLIIPVCKC